MPNCVSITSNFTGRALEQMNNVINWNRIEKIMMNYYKVGTSNKGTDSYPPLMLFKCLLLQEMVLNTF